MPPEEKNNQVQELGTCSQLLLAYFKAAELNYEYYKTDGLERGESLVTAHTNHTIIKNNFYPLDCETVDYNSGKVIKITTSSTDNRLNEIFRDLYEANFSICQNLDLKSLNEKRGCSHISLYMNSLGYKHKMQE